MRRPLFNSAALLCCSLLLTATAFAAEPEVQARRLLNALGCKACHKFNGDGGSLAPVLDQIGSRLTKEQIERHLAAHAETRTHGFMPSFSTTPADELKILSDFLHNNR
jgi:ubiquinol-cytochrome c reductase cytochrome b subunit